MTSKERVSRAIHFQTPDRLPVMFDSVKLNDTYKVVWNQIVPWEDWKYGAVRKFDEWGCGWQRTEFINMGRVTVHPIWEWSNS